MRVFVIGGSGFIGSRLLEVLRERGHEVRNYDRIDSPVIDGITTIGEVTDTAAIAATAAGHDIIVNLAAAHRDDVRPVSLYDEINVDGARAVIAAAKLNGIERILFTSSVAVYGLDKNDAAEDSVPEPYNDYGRTKLEAEKVYRAWAAEDPARSLVIVRPSVVFGEGNRGNVYTLARQVSSGRFIMVGTGSNKKSMTYVGNIVEYLADLLDSPPGVHTSNYADKPDLSTRELIDVLRSTMDLRGNNLRLPLRLGLAAGHALDLVARASRRTFPISAIRIRKFVSDTTVNTDRLESTGYRPRYSLAEGIKRTIEAEFPPSERKRP
ncbi:MAG: UDP-glucose 4-epimerase [Rhodoglobus sp.]|nr:UDP-glucose 4-epimerase [Rhodoglobus sp.]